MAYKIKLYDYSLENNDYCIGSDRLNLVELNWQLECANGDDVDVHISSVGGSAFEAIGMYDALKKYPGKVTTFVDSLAASAASIIAMAGNECVMSKYALLMIHKPMVGSGGNADELIADAAMLNVVQSRLAGIYMDKTGLDEETINELINATTWLTADQAQDLGFIDRIEDYTGEVVTNIAMLKVYAKTAPAVYQRVFNKLQTTNTNTETMKVEDQKLVDAAKALISKVTNWFKAAPNKTVTNKGTINSLVPLAIGVAVTNQDGEDLEDGEYEVDNAGKKITATVAGGIVTAMAGDETDVENVAATEAEKEDVKNEAVLNSYSLKITNKAEAAGIAKVITNQAKELNESAALIVDLNKQIKVLNTAVDRDEAKIRATIQSTYQPSGSQRSTTTTAATQGESKFAPKGATAQAVVNRALNKQPGLVSQVAATEVAAK